MEASMTLPIHVKAGIRLNPSGPSVNSSSSTSTNKALGKLDISLHPSRSLTSLQGPGKACIDQVLLSFKLPKRVKSLAKVMTSQGSCILDPKTNELRWDVGRVIGELTSVGLPLLSIDLNLDLSVEYTPTLRYMELSYKLGHINMSGLKIATVHIQDETYSAFKGMRSSTVSKGKHQIRIIC
jgi:hypothetical protein